MDMPRRKPKSCMICGNRKERRLIMDFLLHHCRGQTLDPIDARLGMSVRWGINLDWHLFSDVLEHLRENGDVEHAGFGHDRMTKYKISRE